MTYYGIYHSTTIPINILASEYQLYQLVCYLGLELYDLQLHTFLPEINVYPLKEL